MFKKQGFTLIELVIVIVVLGVLSAVAVPKFLNISQDARIASLNNIRGALNSTSLLTSIKAKIEDVEDGSIEVNGETVTIESGYISGHWNNAWKYALDVGEEIDFTNISNTCTSNALCGVGNQTNIAGLPSDLVLTGGKGLVLIWFEGDKLSSLCYAFYYNPLDGTLPTTGIVDDGC